jgi:DNA replication and repair protein RecF
LRLAAGGQNIVAEDLRVRHLVIEGLRNIDHVELALDLGQNLLVGVNGQGKTTILEALYLLGAVRSFRGARPSELIQYGAQEARVRGTIETGGPPSTIVVTLAKHSRQIRVDGKRAELAVHFSRFPMVAFHPGDLELVFGGPAARRRFLDRMLFQAEPGYATWFREYRRALQSRNELLKTHGSDAEVKAYDTVMSALGAHMGTAREKLVELLAEATVEILERLNVEPFNMRLKSRVEPKEEKLREALERSLPTDRRRGRTSVGPHTDELELIRKTGLARTVASRGEARALAVSMRLGERKAIARCSRSTPLLLLDDVWAELDSDRADRVLALVTDEPGQVFVTGTGVNVPKTVEGWRRYEVLAGHVSFSSGAQTDLV